MSRQPGLLARSSRRWLVRHPLQLALAIAGVAFGVAIVLGVDLANASAGRAFELAAESVAGRATHRITGGPAGLDEELYRRLRVDLGAGAAAPQIAGGAILSQGGQRHALTLLGIDALAESALRPWLAFGGGIGKLDLRALLLEPGAIAMTEEAAARCGIAPGEECALEVHGYRAPARLAGLLAPHDARIAAGLEAVAVADIATAQELLRRLGRLDAIDLRLPPGAAGDALGARIAGALPPGAALEPTGAQAGALGRLTGAFRVHLQALALLVLVIGGFLIFNAVQFSVVQRRAAIGVLRAVGATRAQLLRSVLAEAALVGAAGTAAGLVLGPALAASLLGVVTRTINDLYFTVAVTEVALPASAFAKALALGLAVCIAAALRPALEATRVPPREALLRTVPEQRLRRALPRLWGWTALSAVAAAALLALAPPTLVVAYAGLFAAVLGAACLVPPVCAVLLRLAAPALRALGGASAAHAARGAAASLHRTAVATAALMLAIAASVGLGAMIASFRHSVAVWLETVLRADVYVSVPSPLADRDTAVLSPAIVPRLRRAEGVAAATAYRRFTAPLRARGDLEPLGQLTAFESGAASLASFAWLQGEPDALAGALGQPGGAIVSEPLAYRLGLAPGDALEVRAGERWRALRVHGVFKDFASERGVVMIDRDATYRPWWHDDAVSSLALRAAPGVAPDALAQRLRALAGEAGQALAIRSNRALREASLAVFDRTFAVTVALRLLCVAVAFLGIWSALLALQLDRTREIGVLRALGALPRQVVALVLVQTGLLGLCAGLLALPVGLLLGWLLVTVINRRAFGWTLLDLQLPLATAAEALLVALAAALLAGLYPALRFARLRTAEALREDG